MSQIEKNRFRIILAVVLLGLAIATRFMPHPANFTAVGAAALFAGALFPKKWGIFLPLVAMILSDIFLGYHKTMLFTWSSMAVIGLIGVYVRSHMRAFPVVLASLAGSVQFFLVTNFGVWLVEQMYPKTVAGLMQSYVMGLPFFRNSLLGDLLFTGVLFGGYALALRFVQHRALIKETI